VDLRPLASRAEDALVVVPFEDLVADAEDEPHIASQDPDEVIPFVARLIPEPLTKAGFCAGPGYGVSLAPPGTLPPHDPVLLDEPDGVTFLEHVRASLGGLSGGRPTA